MSLRANYERIQNEINRAAAAAGRSSDEIKLIAVSKTVSPERVQEAWNAGLRHFGENRAQELVKKTDALEALSVHWHFIGHIQKNKARFVAPRSGLIHTLDSVKLAELISKHTPLETEQPVLIQVNTTGESSKAGIEPGGLTALLDGLALVPRLRIDGLMTIGPLGGNERKIGAAFRDLRLMLEREGEVKRPNQPLRELSMGMSGDFPIAIAEGATLIRIGTAIFGAREPG
jgi:PLP dependent protein